MNLAFDTNWVSTVGENINEVEKNMEKLTGNNYAVALSSGTAALHLAVIEAGVKSGDRVFCSDLTFCATINPVLYEGGIPVFIDSEYETWNMDPRALERAFQQYPDTKAVICANLYGVPAKLDEIRAVCDRYNAVLIEDAAESLGALYKGKKSGVFGQFNVVSFNGNKIITGSTGGCMLTDDKVAAEHVRKLSTQAKDPAMWYQHTEIGYNYRMSNIIAGIIRGQLEHLDEHIEQKKAIYERYSEGFKDLPVSMNPFTEDCKPNYWLSCILLDKDAMCPQELLKNSMHYVPETGKSCPVEILEQLHAMNVEGRPIWKPLHMQPVYSQYPFVTAGDQICVSEDIFERGLCLPSDNKINPEDQEKIINAVRSCFQ